MALKIYIYKNIRLQKHILLKEYHIALTGFMFSLHLLCEITLTVDKYFPNEIVYDCIFAQMLKLQDPTHISFGQVGFTNYCDFLELPCLIM